MKNTQQRKAIISVFEKQKRPLNANELHVEAMKQVKRIGIATIYRAIKSLKDEKVIVAANIPGEAPYYELSNLKHHHHFKCNSCGVVLDVEECLIDESKLKKSASKNGLKIKEHSITLFGECDACV